MFTALKKMSSELDKMNELLVTVNIWLKNIYITQWIMIAAIGLACIIILKKVKKNDQL